MKWVGDVRPSVNIFVVWISFLISRLDIGPHYRSVSEFLISDYVTQKWGRRSEFRTWMSSLIIRPIVLKLLMLILDIGPRSRFVSDFFDFGSCDPERGQRSIGIPL